MKLAALGALAAGIGLLVAAPGLVGIGGYWILAGLLVRALAPRTVLAARLRRGSQDAPAGGTAAPPLPTRSQMMTGTALMILVAVPSLVVGLAGIGFDTGDAAWRWAPVVVGAYAALTGVLGGVLYLLADGIATVTGNGTTPTVPATLRIRSVRETGTFVNERPRLELDLDVEPDSGSGCEPYQVTKKATVPFTALAYLRVGEGFRAVVAGPGSPTSMTIHWDRPVAAGSGSDLP